MLEVTDAAAQGIVLLHYAALHATDQWAPLMAKSKHNQGKRHLRSLVAKMAELYEKAFDDHRPRHPSAVSPVVRFCHFLAGILFQRMARYLAKYHQLPQPPLPDELLELRALGGAGGEAKVVEFLRPARRKDRENSGGRVA
jgi:hypothetical protein